MNAKVRRVDGAPVTVTVCQLADEAEGLAEAWERLAEHVRRHASELVVLPETPFFKPLGATSSYNQGRWNAALEAHHRWERRLSELAPAAVIATQPIDFGNERYNQGFIWTRDAGLRSVHAQASLRCEEGAWESHWYHQAPSDFVPMQVGRLRIGFLIGPELWRLEDVRHYRKEAVDVIVTPRIGAPPRSQAWIAVASHAARQTGAFSLSSCRPIVGDVRSPGGWVIAPEGEVLALTSAEQPFVSVALDLHTAEDAHARHTGPASPIPI